MHCISGREAQSIYKPSVQRVQSVSLSSRSCFILATSFILFITIMAGRVLQLLVVGGGLTQSTLRDFTHAQIIIGIFDSNLVALASPMPALLTLLEPAGLTATVSASIAGVDSHGATTYILTESAQTGTSGFLTDPSS
jgi:hypothetical protein